jgi:hypothetical protein
VFKIKRQVFFSFHYQNDNWRVMNIRNIGALEDNKPLAPNEWEKVRTKGCEEIKKWINEQMSTRSCVVVFIGEKTAKRKYVKYEIRHAWNTNKGIVGIYINNLKDKDGRTSEKGVNPFSKFYLVCEGKTELLLENVVKAIDPNPRDVYGEIAANLNKWVEDAIKIRKEYPHTECLLTTKEVLYGDSMDRMSD